MPITVQIYWIVFAILIVWAFAPRFLNKSSDPRMKKVAAFMNVTGNLLGLALLAFFIFGAYQGIHLLAAMDSR